MAFAVLGCGGQAPRADSDGDGVPDRLDNAPSAANAPRLDMNADGSVDHRDQLDNDFDTELGNPGNPSTSRRLGDPADPDDDNDAVGDRLDLCPFVADPDQRDVDDDGRGDECDPLDDRDTDGDGVPDGPPPDHPLFEEARAARVKWSTGTTHFVIRIDALSAFFQNEFTQLITDAATLSPAQWAAKCWENYANPDDPPDPCGTGEGRPDQTLMLPGGQEVPITLFVIPGKLWADRGVVEWINDRNDNPLLEIGQHGTYHADNTRLGDWRSLPDRSGLSCEVCGLSGPESVELMRIGYDTLTGAYGNKWVAQSGAAAFSPRIDWSSSANPLLSYAPPFNASDAAGRRAVGQLGFRAFSASVFEEEGFYGTIFSPEESHHEQFDQFGMFHASADIELEPPDTTGNTYDVQAYEEYLASHTHDDGLTVWLIEEVEWSGRPCNNADRLGSCNGRSNRENNTVYLPRWVAWLQVLDYVKRYPGGVAMTMGEVALAMSYDNAPTVPNPDQADADHDGIGNVIDEATPRG